MSNYGVNRDGFVVVMDFGELIFDRDEALKIASARTWSAEREAVNELPEPYKSAYLDMMLDVLSPERIEREWGRGHNKPIELTSLSLGSSR